MSVTPEKEPAGDPLVEIRAAVRADSLKFKNTPVTNIRLKVEPDGRTESRTKRKS